MKLFLNFISIASISLTLVLLTGASHDKAVAGDQGNPIPFLNVPLVPDSASPGGSDFVLTVNGTGFVSDSVVQWNGTPLATTFLNGSQLTAMVPAANIAVPGTAVVSALTPGPGGGTSSGVPFTIRSPFSAASFDQSVIQVGSEPTSVIATDLNGDGKDDLVTTLANDAAVAVSIGNGDNTFQSPVLYQVAGAAIAVVVADINSDGKADLAVTTRGASASILLGKGNGAFGSRRDVNLGGDAEQTLAAGDFNQDGNLDLAIVLDPGFVAVLLGNGDGTFQSPHSYPVGSDRAFGIVIGDLNRDGHLDLAVTVFAGAVVVLPGNGDGTFQSGTSYPTAPGSFFLVVGDFNKDNKLDFAVQTGFGWLSVLLGNGDGTFQSHTDYEVAFSQNGLATADVNGDGSLDLVISSYRRPHDHILTVLLGRSDGTFTDRSDFATGDGSVPNTVAVGDFNGDGRLDLVTANLQDSTLSILPQVTSVLSRTYLKFGNVRVGDNSTRKVTLTNIGSTSLDISRIVLDGKTKTGYIEADNCPATLRPRMKCKINIIFEPLAPGPYKKARVKVNDSAVTTPQKIYLFGTGTK